MSSATLPWLQASVVEPGNVYYARHSFATTKRQNKVSKESVLCGSDNIGVKGKTIIEAGAIIRGDLSTIELGSFCVIGSHAVIRPAEQKFQGRIAYIPMTIGDHVLIEEGCIVEAAAIGDCTHIGRNAQIGPRCIISPCCVIQPGAVLAPNSVTAPFSIWGGIPATQVGKLPESFQAIWQDHTRRFYKHFLPIAPTSAAAAAGAPPTPAAASATPATPARPSRLDAPLSASPAASSVSAIFTPTRPKPAAPGSSPSSTDMPLPPTPGQK